MPNNLRMIRAFEAVLWRRGRTRARLSDDQRPARDAARMQDRGVVKSGIAVYAARP